MNKKLKIKKSTKVKSGAFFDFENSDNLLIAGLDEAGRGPWAGPIVASAYIPHKKILKTRIDDSKKLNKAQREDAYAKLIKSGFYGIGIAESWEIDRFGLMNANQKAFTRAIEDLILKFSKKPDLILIDGKDKILPKVTLHIPFKTIIKGDSLVYAISGASIIAKVTRDSILEEYSRDFPEYGFESHKGYGTSKHTKAILQYGPTKIHRHSYKPVITLSEKWQKKYRALKSEV